MTNTPDMTAMLKDAMGAFSIDATAANGAFKSTADLNEKLGAVTLNAAEKSAVISQKWSKETLKGLADVTKAKSEPADYMQAMTDFMTDYASSATEHMTSLGEIAKQAQTDTLELMTAAGKTFTEESKTATKKATKKAASAK